MSMINASTAICAVKRHRPISSATTREVTPTFTSRPRVLKRKRFAKTQWKVARSKRLATTAHNFSSLRSAAYFAVASRTNNSSRARWNATVIIAQRGSMVAIAGGQFRKPQRFTGHWTKEGLTIYLGEGRTIENKTDHITFSLSPDGKLVEKGIARFTQMGGHFYSNPQVAYENFEGSFRRGTLADGARVIGK
jgi:hypothetical protein